MKNRNLISSVIYFLPLVIVLLFVGCAKEDKVEPTYSSLWDNVFSGCGVSCHSVNSTDGTQSGPILDSKQNFYQNLVGKNTAADYPNWIKTGDCDSINYITPGNANQSTLAGALILSVSDALKSSSSCDSAYNIHSVTNDVISDEDTANALIQWINDGAAND